MRKEIRFCPKCGSTDVVIDGKVLEFSAGAMMCKNCGFSDIVFPIRIETDQEKVDK